MRAKLLKLVVGVLLVGGAALGFVLLRRRLAAEAPAPAPMAPQAPAAQPPPPTPAAAEPPPPAGLDLRTASREELYREAQRREVPGRSRMTKAQLRAALTKEG